MPPVFRIEMLGKLRFIYRQQILGSIGTNRLQSLLAYLVLHADAPQSREQLAALLWPESNESQARTNLRQLLHHLRRALPQECSLLETDNHTAMWRTDPACSIDVVQFEGEVSRAGESETRGDDMTARQALQHAATLYQDDLLPDLYDAWLEDSREQLRQQYSDVLTRLAGLLQNAGEYAAAIRHATRLVAMDPLRETSYQLLMRLHMRNRDRSSALRVYHECMRTLKRELGITPAKATQDLFRRALKSEEPAASAVAPVPAASGSTPMLGRAEEVQQLLGCWQRSAAGETLFALIVGEPGVGKSRLAEEVAGHCSHHPGGMLARARCYFAQGRIAYGPVAEWLRSAPLESARARLARAQRRELARVLPEILVEDAEIAAPAPLTESWQKRHLYEALNAAFGNAVKPMLLFIDDLQWCDYETFEWLHSFLRSPASTQTLILGTARAEDVGRDHPLTALGNELRQSGQLVEIPLASLSAEDVAALVAQVAGRECDPAVLGALYQTTRGNPLFVIETVRAGFVQRPFPLPAERIGLPPPRVQAVIGARLLNLSPAAYELAGIAATVGRPFSMDLLAKITDWDETGLWRAVEELWDRRIVEGQGASGEYDYTHDLVREVAYSLLSPIRRRFYHRRVARALEESHAADVETVSGQLAAHYEAAGVAEEAIRHYRTAAAVAKRRFADAEAADHIRRALRLCRDFPESPRRDQAEMELLVTLGPLLVTTHGYSMPEVGETYDRGLLLANQSGDEKYRFSLLSGAWLFHMVGGNLKEARRVGQECIAAGDRSPAIKMAGRFLLGCTLFHMGRLAESLELIEEATPSSGEFRDPAVALFAGPDLGVFCRSYLSHLHWLCGDAVKADASSEAAVALARGQAHPFSLAIALDYAAMLSLFRDDPARALEAAEESAGLCRKYSFAYYLAWAEMVAGWADAMRGDPATGLSRFRGGLEAFRATGAELRLPFYYALAAEICESAGNSGDALANVSSGFAFQNQNGETWWAPELHRIHGDLLRRAGNEAEAQASYARAVEHARTTGARMLEVKAARRLTPPPKEKRSRKASER